jgi:hypothetical protein
MWSRALQDPTALVLVAVEGASIVGFCSSLPSRDPDASSSVADALTKTEERPGFSLFEMRYRRRI